MDASIEKRELPEFCSPIYELALNQFLSAARQLKFDDNIIERMKSPERSLLVSLPACVLDGTQNVRIEAEVGEIHKGQGLNSAFGQRP